MTFQHPADWTPLQECEPPLEQYCVVMRVLADGNHWIFTAWARKESDSRLWWWSNLRTAGGVPTNNPVKMLAAVKSRDYWLRLTHPVGVNAGPVSKSAPLAGGYSEAAEEAYWKKLNRAFTKRMLSMRDEAAASKKKKAGKK